MTPDFDKRMEARVRELAAEADGTSMAFDRVRRRLVARRRRSRQAISAGVAALVVTVAGVVVASILTGQPDATVVAGPPPSVTPPAGDWSRPFAGAPIAGRMGHAAVAAAGERMVVWGGVGPRSDGSVGHLADGAVYDRTTDEWRMMSPAPIVGRQHHVAFWDGNRMVVWGGDTDRGQTELNDGAYYDVATDTWTKIPAAPIAGRRYTAAAFSGVDLYVYGGSSGDGAFSIDFDDGAAYDSETRRWRVLPPSPLGRRRDAASVWAGTTWFVWGGQRGESDEPLLDGAEFDGTRWTSLPPLPAGIPAPRLLIGEAWTGDEMLVFGTSEATDMVVGVAYHPKTRTWRNLATAPFQSSHYGSEMVTWTGDRLAAWSGTTLFEYFPGPDRWREAPTPPLTPRADTSVTWSGTAVLLWGGENASQGTAGSTPSPFFGDGAAYVPGPPPGN